MSVIRGIHTTPGTYTKDYYIRANHVFNRGKGVVANSNGVGKTLPSDNKPVNTLKDNVVYYGFGLTYESVIKNGKKKDATFDERVRYTATSNKDTEHFYVIYPTSYTGSKPVEFTCGSAPMVMFKSEKKLDDKNFVVFESGEIYPGNLELSIISENK